MNIIDKIRKQLDRLTAKKPDQLLRCRWAHGTLDAGIDTDGRYIGLPDEVISSERWNMAGFGVRAPENCVVIGVWYGAEQIYDAQEWMPTVLGERCAIVDGDEVRVLADFVDTARIEGLSIDPRVNEIIARMCESADVSLSDPNYGDESP